MTDKLVSSLERDAQIIEALHLARYTLVIHEGMKVLCEGQSWTLEFRDEITKLDTVMTMLGVDLTEPLPAPVNWKPKEGDDDE